MAAPVRKKRKLNTAITVNDELDTASDEADWAYCLHKRFYNLRALIGEHNHRELERKWQEGGAGTVSFKWNDTAPDVWRVERHELNMKTQTADMYVTRAIYGNIRWVWSPPLRHECKLFRLHEATPRHDAPGAKRQIEHIDMRKGLWQLCKKIPVTQDKHRMRYFNVMPFALLDDAEDKVSMQPSRVIKNCFYEAVPTLPAGVVHFLVSFVTDDEIDPERVVQTMASTFDGARTKQTNIGLVFNPMHGPVVHNLIESWTTLLHQQGDNIDAKTFGEFVRIPGIVRFLLESKTTLSVQNIQKCFKAFEKVASELVEYMNTKLSNCCLFEIAWTTGDEENVLYETGYCAVGVTDRGDVVGVLYHS